ncbi:hypothetical protein D3C84_1215670 [compost metagenome]
MALDSRSLVLALCSLTRSVDSLCLAMMVTSWRLALARALSASRISWSRMRRACWSAMASPASLAPPRSAVNNLLQMD